MDYWSQSAQSSGWTAPTYKVLELIQKKLNSAAWTRSHFHHDSLVRPPLIYVQQCHVPVHVGVCMCFCVLHTLTIRSACLCVAIAPTTAAASEPVCCVTMATAIPQKVGEGAIAWGGIGCAEEGERKCAARKRTLRLGAASGPDASEFCRLIWTFNVVTRETKNGDTHWGLWVAERSQPPSHGQAVISHRFATAKCTSSLPGGLHLQQFCCCCWGQTARSTYNM